MKKQWCLWSWHAACTFPIASSNNNNNNNNQGILQLCDCDNQKSKLITIVINFDFWLSQSHNCNIPWLLLLLLLLLEAIGKVQAACQDHKHHCFFTNRLDPFLDEGRHALKIYLLCFYINTIVVALLPAAQANGQLFSSICTPFFS